MENYSLDEIVVLRVKNICCTAYQKKLKKELSKISGVYAIAINPEKSLVSVKGQVDATLVLNTITRTGKHAEIISYPSTNNPNESRHYQNTYENKRNDYYQRPNPSPKKNPAPKDEWEEQHSCEAYIPPPIDERICRDFYCRSHNMRPTFSDSSPHGSFPFRTYNQPPLNGYGLGFGPRAFGQPPSLMYGYYPRMPMQGFGNYGSYGYGSGRGWPYM